MRRQPILTTLMAVAAVVSIAAPSFGAGTGGDDPAPIVRSTTLGPVAGNDDSKASGTWSWKGIPYAAPPVGALRWRAPVDPAPWTATRPALTFGNACIQYGRIYGPGANNRYDATIGTTLGQAVGSEDCLYLNIWRPATTQGSLPVIVFIHGGSNVSGYTADPLYDGAALAKGADAVVVTVNYRLGIFGWLALPQFKASGDADPSGNFALLDQIKALRFVQANAERFGGDPSNVTLIGQSAGAIDTYALLSSPIVSAAKPRLFAKIVALSGGLSLATELPPGSLPTLNPEAVALAQGNALLVQQLIADGRAGDPVSAEGWVATHTPAETAAYLRGKPPTALLATLVDRLTPLGLSGSGPIPDGQVVPYDPVLAIRAGRYLQVPVLAGNTRDEGKLFPAFLALSPLLGGVSGRRVSDETLFETQFNYQPDAAPTVSLAQWIPDRYLPVDAPFTGFNAETDLLGRIFLYASRDSILAALQTRQAGRIWYYRFDWDREPAPWNGIYGAAHLFDVPFIFGNFGPSLFGHVMASHANEPGRLALSQAMMQGIAAFARSGDPNNPALGVAWPAWPRSLIFDADLNGKKIEVRERAGAQLR